jgi:hypothetical protein
MLAAAATLLILTNPTPLSMDSAAERIYRFALAVLPPNKT